MWGTRRIGPDLARETGRRREDWQLVHLFNPRYVVPDSMMPSYPWMFDGDADHPSGQAIDLIAYLQSLGRPAALLVPASTGTISVSSPPRSEGPSPEGRRVFLAECAGCHGVNGDGLSPGGRALRPVAFNLAGNELTGAIVWRTLQRGVRGSSMQSWTALPADELEAVAAYAESLGQAGDLPQDARWASDETLLEAGRRVFDTHCSRCHGEDGGANGPDAAKRDPRPANFHEMRPSYPAAAQAIHVGRPRIGDGIVALAHTGRNSSSHLLHSNAVSRAGPSARCIRPASRPRDGDGSMTGVMIGAATVILLAMIVARRLSPEFRRRVEQPKYRFLANLEFRTDPTSSGEKK